MKLPSADTITGSGSTCCAVKVSADPPAKQRAVDVSSKKMCSALAPGGGEADEHERGYSDNDFTEANIWGLPS